MELYIVRHGESVGNITPEVDMPDCPLTERGKEQADLLAKKLENIHFTHILSSPLIRALETAKPLAKRLDKPIHVMKNAYEIRRAASSVRCTPLDELKESFPEAIFPNDFDSKGIYSQGNEDSGRAVERVDTIIKEFLQFPSESVVVLFAHGIFNSYLIRRLLKVEDLEAVQMKQENTNVNWFTIDETSITINQIGNTEHLN